jgi:transposase
MPRTARRDPKPEPFWRDLIGRWRASGRSVAAFCAAHGVGQATFSSWRKRLAAAGLLAHVIVSKYVDHLPLYRQESILGRLGWGVTRSTLCDQILACAGVLEPRTG